MANRRTLVAVGCLVTLGFASQARAERQPVITVTTYNQAGVDNDILVRATTEVVRIYREAGVAVIWTAPGAKVPTETFAIQLLIRRRAVAASGSVMGTALGETHDTGGSAFIFYDRVLRSAHGREQDVAGVLAYAMAHEMGHLLLPFPAHSPSGIMRADWDGDDLRHMGNGSLQFTPIQTNAIRVKAITCCVASGQTTL
jgi:hypothetical protein